MFVGWLKADGAAVRAGEPLFTLESEKATEDIEGFDDGILHIPADGPRQGDVIPVGNVIGYVLQPGEPIPAGEARRSPRRRQAEPAEPARSAAQPPLSRRHRHHRAPGQFTASSPQPRPGSASTGRLPRARAGAGASANAMSSPWPPGLRTPSRSGRQLDAPHHRGTHADEPSVHGPRHTHDDDRRHQLVQLRERLKAPRPAAAAIVPTFTDLFINLTALAPPATSGAQRSLGQRPRRVVGWNSYRHCRRYRRRAWWFPSCATCPLLSLQDLAVRTRDLIERARQRRLSASELQGGTFTVTSLGSLGIDAFTPIINYPECAILGIGRIRRCPAVVDDQIVIRDQVTLSLTFDHRITDGAPAARFLQTLSAAVDNPEVHCEMRFDGQGQSGHRRRPRHRPGDRGSTRSQWQPGHLHRPRSGRDPGGGGTIRRRQSGCAWTSPAPTRSPR